MLAGNAAVEKAAADGRVTTSRCRSRPGRTDATQEQTDVESFAALEPTADGFRNYLGKGHRLPAEYLLRRPGQPAHPERARDDRARRRPAGARRQPRRQSSLGVLTDRPGTLTNDFFVNLLDLGTTWTPTSDDAETFEGRDASGAVTLDRQPRRPGLRLELRAAGARRGLRQRRRAGEVRPRLRRRLGQGHGPRPLRRALTWPSRLLTRHRPGLHVVREGRVDAISTDAIARSAFLGMTRSPGQWRRVCLDCTRDSRTPPEPSLRHDGPRPMSSRWSCQEPNWAGSVRVAAQQRPQHRRADQPPRQSHGGEPEKHVEDHSDPRLTRTCAHGSRVRAGPTTIGAFRSGHDRSARGGQSVRRRHGAWSREPGPSHVTDPR